MNLGLLQFSFPIQESFVQQDREVKEELKLLGTFLALFSPPKPVQWRFIGTPNQPDSTSSDSVCPTAISPRCLTT